MYENDKLYLSIGTKDTGRRADGDRGHGPLGDVVLVLLGEVFELVAAAEEAERGDAGGDAARGQRRAPRGRRPARRYARAPRGLRHVGELGAHTRTHVRPPRRRAGLTLFNLQVNTISIAS